MDSDASYDVLSVGQWLLTILLISLPFVNLIVLLFWAFHRNAHPSRRNFARAYLILLALIAGLLLAIALLGGFPDTGGGFLA